MEQKTRRAPKRPTTTESVVAEPVVAKETVVEASKPKSKKEKKVRNCMRCNKEFMSQGNHNRICYWCKETDDWRYGNDYSIMK